MTLETAGRLLVAMATLFYCCSPSAQRGQQFYFTNSQQPAFLSSFQQPQYENFFQPQSSYQPSPFHLPASNNAPQSFSTFQQGSPLYHRPQDYRQRAPSFLDQITLSPRGFARDQRLLQAYPSDFDHPPSIRPAPQDFPSEPDDLGLSTFVDQNLEVDQRPTEDPKSAPRPKQKDRTGDMVLRRKPGTRPQAGSRNNFLLPQRIRGDPPSDTRGDSTRSAHREADTQYPSTVSTRTRGRFSPTTKAPSEVRQFSVKHSKTPFTPRRPFRPAHPLDADEPDSLEYSELPINVSVHPEIIHKEKQVTRNSTLIEDSDKVTMLLHDEVTTDEQENTTYAVTEHTETTNIDDVTTILSEEPSKMLKEEETPEKRLQVNENNSSTYEVLTMNPGHTLVEEDNFRGFVDSVLIDATDVPQMSTESEDITTEVAPGVSLETTLKPLDISVESTQKPVDVSMVTTLNSKLLDASGVTSEDSKALDISIITTASSRPLGVSVVTTKSVINGTMFAVPSTYSVAPPVFEQVVTPIPAKEQPESTYPTESWVVVASVQTSRSVSGARFLPSSAVKQEEVPKSLSGKTSPSEAKQSSKSAHSTESIIDKLYVVESELSSGILTGGFRPEGKKLQLEVLTDMTDTTPTPASMTHKSPVFIRKFTSHSSRTTPKPNKLTALFDSIPKDDLSRLLPPGFKQRTPTSRRITTPPAKRVNPLEYPERDEPVKPSSASTRLSGLSSKFKMEDSTSVVKPPKKLEDLSSKIMFDNISAFLPPGFKQPVVEAASTTVKPSVMEGLQNKPLPVNISAFLPLGFKPPAEGPTSMTLKPSGVEGLLRKAQPVDVSAFLPPGFKLPAREPTSTTAKPSSVEGVLSKARPVDISGFLPPAFKLPTGETTSTTAKPSSVEGLLSKARPVDISGFLPPGFKLPAGEPTSTTAKPSSVEGLLSKARPVDLSGFLPPGFKLKTTTEKSTFHSSLGEVEGFRDNGTLVPPGFRNENSSTTEAATPADVFRVKFPTRSGVTRKFLIPTHKPIQGPDIPKPKISTGWPTRATTEFTGWPTSSTTPIPLEKLLEMNKTVTTTSSSTSSSSTTSTTTSTTTTTTTTTPRPTTPGVCAEDCDMASTVKLVGGVTWVPELLDHNTEEWQHLASEVQRQLETVYRKSELLGRWFRKIRIDSFSDSDSMNAVDSGHGTGSVLVDYIVELTDLGRHVDTQEMKKLFHSSLTAAEHDTVVSSRLQLGSFVLDPKYTDFIVLSKQVVPTMGYADEDVFVPQWAIAGIVIGLASLLFVIIFGVTVLVNRNKNNKKKSPTPLTEDMLNELNKNHMGGLDNYGADDLYNMEDVWNDKPSKKRSSGSVQESSMSNLYDSWRSEWNGYYYNAYYGHGNTGSSTSGHSRRRSDYDTNF